MTKEEANKSLDVFSDMINRGELPPDTVNASLLIFIARLLSELLPNENKKQRVGTECTHPTKSPAKQDVGEGETNYFICDDCKEPC